MNRRDVLTASVAVAAVATSAVAANAQITDAIGASAQSGDLIIREVAKNHHDLFVQIADWSLDHTFDGTHGDIVVTRDVYKQLYHANYIDYLPTDEGGATKYRPTLLGARLRVPGTALA